MDGEAFTGWGAGLGRDDTDSGLRWVGLGLRAPRGVPDIIMSREHWQVPEIEMVTIAKGWCLRPGKR